MNAMEIPMQKVLNATKKNLFFLCLLNSFLLFSQEKIVGTFSISTGVVDNGSSLKFKFHENGIFERNTSGELGEVDYGKGHYLIKNDSLFLNYDLTELKTNDYHKHKYYLNDKDSISVKITIRDMDNKPLADVPVINIDYNLIKYSNKEGVVECKIKREKKETEFSVTNYDLGYYFSIWLDRNYQIDVFLKGDYATPYKNMIVKYKIIKLTKNMIKLQTESKHVMVLKKREIR